MKNYNPDSENALESEAISLFEQLGWQTLNCYDEKIGNNKCLDKIICIFTL